MSSFSTRTKLPAAKPVAEATVIEVAVFAQADASVVLVSDIDSSLALPVPTRSAKAYPQTRHAQSGRNSLKP
jgi:hypothetical protein